MKLRRELGDKRKWFNENILINTIDKPPKFYIISNVGETQNIRFVNRFIEKVYFYLFLTLWTYNSIKHKFHLDLITEI